MERFSISKIIQYCVCPRAYFYIYVHDFQLKKTDNLFYGSAIHAGLAAHFRGQDSIEEYIKYTNENASQMPPGYNEEKYLESGIKILEAYKKEGTYFDPNPDWIERKEIIKLKHPVTDEVIETPYSFTMDLITKDKYVVDHKTSSSAKGDQSETNRIQGIAYCLAYKTIFREQPRGFIQNIIVKQKKPKFISRVFHYTQDDELYVFNLIKHILDRIEKNGYLIDKPSIKTFFPCPIGVLCDIHRKKI